MNLLKRFGWKVTAFLAVFYASAFIFVVSAVFGVCWVITHLWKI